METDEPTGVEELFAQIVTPMVECDLTHMSYEALNQKRAETSKTIGQLMTYMNTFLPHDPMWLHSRNFSLFLIGELKRIDQVIEQTFMEFFKSNGDAAIEHVMTTIELKDRRVITPTP